MNGTVDQTSSDRGAVDSSAPRGGRTGHERDTDDEASAIDELFDAHVDLADRLARRYSFGTGTDDDLRQVARIGLLLSCRRFDPEVGLFVRFATVTIIGELKKHLRAHGWGVRVPRGLQEDAITVAAAKDRLAVRLGREATVGEVASRTGFSQERVVEATRAQEARFSRSVEQIHVDPPGHSSPEDAAVLTHALESLDADQQRLVRLRFAEGLTQKEIAATIGISQPQVHRRLARAIAKLRDTLSDDEF